MGGVADQEDPAAPVLAGDLGADDEAQPFGAAGRELRNDAHVQVGLADGRADQFDRLLLGDRLQCLALGHGGGEDPPLLAVVREQDGGGRGFVEVADADVAAPGRPAQVRLEEHREGGGELAGSVRLDAQLAPDGAAAAVGRDEVGGAHGALLATGGVPEHGGDSAVLALAALLEGHQFGAEGQFGTEFGGAAAQQVLEPVLVDGGPHSQGLTPPVGSGWSVGPLNISGPARVSARIISSLLKSVARLASDQMGPSSPTCR